MNAPLTPVLDHVVVNVQHGMDDAEAAWRDLGFALTPRGHHTLGSINHLAIFATDYLELIGLPEPVGQPARRSSLLDWSIGANAIVFATENADRTHAALVAAGIEATGPAAFSRPVATPSGPQDARFRTVHLPKEASGAGRVYFCEHATRDLVWRDEDRSHPNTTTGIAAILLAAARPEVPAALFARMFGAESVTRRDGGYRMLCGLVAIEIAAPAALAARFGAIPNGEGREEWLAGFVFRCRSIARAAAAITAPGTARHGDLLVVPPESATGTLLGFSEG